MPHVASEARAWGAPGVSPRLLASPTDALQQPHGQAICYDGLKPAEGAEPSRGAAPGRLPMNALQLARLAWLASGEDYQPAMLTLAKWAATLSSDGDHGAADLVFQAQKHILEMWQDALADGEGLPEDC